MFKCIRLFKIKLSTFHLRLKCVQPVWKLLERFIAFITKQFANTDIFAHILYLLTITLTYNSYEQSLPDTRSLAVSLFFIFK